jgi:hypothetical protein
MSKEAYWPMLKDEETLVMAVESVSGPTDGRKMALIKKADGSATWKCNLRPGEFKQVWVPLDFQHPDLIE